MQCTVVRGDAWPILISPCNTTCITLSHACHVALVDCQVQGAAADGQDVGKVELNLEQAGGCQPSLGVQAVKSVTPDSAGVQLPYKQHSAQQNTPEEVCVVL